MVGSRNYSLMARMFNVLELGSSIKETIGVEVLGNVIMERHGLQSGLRF
jgi:hypothetical protein